MGGLLSALEIVGGAALIATGAGALAGAMLITEGVASSGLIGGSVGKFLNSGVAKGLMAAVSLGSAAVAMYGADATEAGLEAARESAGTAEGTVVGNAGANTIATTAGSDADAAITNTGMINDTQVSQEVGSIANSDPSLASATGTNPESLAASNTQVMGTGPNAQASQAAAQNTSAATQAVKPLAAPGQATAPATPGSGTPQGAAASSLDTTSASPSAQPLAGPTNPMSQASTAPVTPGAPPASGVSGMLGKAASFVGQNPGVAVAGGQALSGIAQGMAQEKTMQEQLAAAQWGNLQWQNPAEVSQLQAAAAKPVTVPQGYLQRAQQVRGLMTGATPSPGVQPLPAASPGAPLAPNPVPVHA
jgi:hypothetical protein